VSEEPDVPTVPVALGTGHGVSLVAAISREIVGVHSRSYEVEPLFRTAIEAITGRRVNSFLSQISKDGVASEVSVLGHATEPPV
jgi:hypothetical protein